MLAGSLRTRKIAASVHMLRADPSRLLEPSKVAFAVPGAAITTGSSTAEERRGSHEGYIEVKHATLMKRKESL